MTTRLLTSARLLRGAILCLALAPLALAPACAGTDSVDDPDDVAEGADDLKKVSTDDALARAEEWVAARLHYCQSPNHEADGDPSCSSVCERKDNSKWDPYRSDCSGLVSWAWGLPAPGRVTTEFAPFESDITHSIEAKDLEPGDAVNSSDHVMLFKRWVTKGHEAVFIEEPGCSSPTPYAHEFKSSVSISGKSISVSYNGMTFTAIRYDGIQKTPVKPKESLAEKEATLDEAEIDGDLTTDIDGDGKADVCAFNGSEIRCYLSDGNKGFRANPINGPTLDGKDFNEAEHYGSIRFGDINGDGKADICVRKSTGVDCFHSKGDSFGAAIKTEVLSDKNGWEDPKNWSSFRLADVDGDGKADLCARADTRFRCWRSNGDGFGEAIEGPEWNEKGAYGKMESWGTIHMADINGDGKMDVCSHNAEGITCYLSDGHGFHKHVEGPKLTAKVWDEAETWATIRFGDINGDGKADLCLRKTDGVKCYLSKGDSFGGEIDGPDLTDAKGWDHADNYETMRLADVNGDGKADLCARANDGVTCWISNGHGFGKAEHTALLDDASKGDDGSHYRTLRFADIDGDGKADLCFRSESGLRCAFADHHGFRQAFDGPAYSDKNNWDDQVRFSTISLAGP